MDGTARPGAGSAISATATAAAIFSLEWEADGVRHRDIRFAPKVRLDLDIFPRGLDAALMGRRAGDKATIDFGPGDLVPPPDSAKVARLPAAKFDSNFIPDRFLVPARGRYFPQGMISDGLPGLFKANNRPCRIVRIDGETLTVDLNSPFAGRAARLETEIVSVTEDSGQGGGRCQDWTEFLTDGPGMQARHLGQPTDFWQPEGFRRAVENDDASFYAKPRMAVHLDSRALAAVTDIYRRQLSSGMQVLDLMSSFRSHLPDDEGLGEVIGLGLNEQEMRRNPQLSGHVVHDLNANPRLPFGTGAFDACVCTVSVEYMRHPVDVFRDVARVLRPDSPFVLTFSHRWFPPKVTGLWTELHPFERTGFVLECLRESGFFADLGSESLRGLPRPADDGYFPQETVSDPVFAVWGRRIS
ncbi:MAG: methyltransferase domain-containing protein [Magnetospirillum sp. WYHS-4]